MTAQLARGAGLTLVVAYWALSVLGAIGNRDRALVLFLCAAPLAYAVAAALVRRHRARTDPATVPAEPSEGR